MHSLLDISSWAPFKIDALGIVTLLGADILRRTTPRLVRNPYSEFLPHLAAHIYADNSIAETLPGYTLFNITDGIKATDLSAWFTRWLSCQTLGWQQTTLHIHTKKATGERAWPASRIFGAFLAVLINAFVIGFAAAIHDWYGFASGLALVTTVLARCYILSECRDSLDGKAGAAQRSAEEVKILITMPNGRVVTVYTTRGITVSCLLSEAVPLNQTLHQLARAAMWISFAILAICLGMSSLCMQLVIVVVLLASTIVEVQRLGTDESYVGGQLRIEQTDNAACDSRSKAYLCLELNETQEESLIKWDLFPMKSNEAWWAKYRALQESWDPKAFTQPKKEALVTQEEL
jgi:hypothetical protein